MINAVDPCRAEVIAEVRRMMLSITPDLGLLQVLHRQLGEGVNMSVCLFRLDFIKNKRKVVGFYKQ